MICQLLFLLLVRHALKRVVAIDVLAAVVAGDDGQRTGDHLRRRPACASIYGAHFKTHQNISLILIV